MSPLETALSGKWVIWSFEHDAYWRANSCGYCHELAGAGLYTEDEARRIVERANVVSVNEERRPALDEARRCLWQAAPGTLGAVLRSATGGEL